MGVRALLIIGLVALTGSSLVGIQQARAATFSTTSDVLTRIQESTAADHTITFGGNHSGVASNETMTVDVSDFTSGVFAVTDVDLGTGAYAGGCDVAFVQKALAATPSGTTVGVAFAAGVLSFSFSPSDSVAANTCIQVKIGANATTGGAGSTFLTNPAATTASVTVSMPDSTADSGTAIIPIVAAAQADEVALTASIGQTISCTIEEDGNPGSYVTAADFGTLTTAAPRYATKGAASGGTTTEAAAYDINSTTNAVNGIRISVRGAILTDGSYTFATPTATPAAGTEQFGMRAVSTGAVQTVAVTYGSPTDYGYGATASTTDQIASTTSGVAANTLAIYLVAENDATTPPGDYTTTLYHVCTGYF